MQNPVKTILGCMSGTSLDGIDLALLTTDGESIIQSGKNFYKAYELREREIIARAFMKYERDETVNEAESCVTGAHIKAINQFIAQEKIDFDMISFHGQTITHDPAKKFTWQIGDAQKISQTFKKPIIYDFRADDVEAGGEGAPLLPIYHRALLQKAGTLLPCVILNIGGVSNITYLSNDALIAFDSGAGNALMDQVMRNHFDADYDKDGGVARTGQVNTECLETLLSNPFFNMSPPKSLDRNPWDLSCLLPLSPKDQLATLMQFTVQAIVKALVFLPEKPKEIFVAGGGRHNKFMMELLSDSTKMPVSSIDTLGFNGDFIEAEGFAYMAARRMYNLPISFPLTTSAPKPMTGGKIIL